MDSVFAALNALPANHPFWRNQWMFTRPVFLHNSRMGTDSAAFGDWTKTQDATLRRYIKHTPTA